MGPYRCRGVEGDSLQHPQADISLQAFLHSVLPVQGDRGGDVAGHRLSIRVYVQLQWGAATDEGKLLPFTGVKGGGFVPGPDVGFQ